MNQPNLDHLIGNNLDENDHLQFDDDDDEIDFSLQPSGLLNSKYND